MLIAAGRYATLDAAFSPYKDSSATASWIGDESTAAATSRSCGFGFVDAPSALRLNARCDHPPMQAGVIAGLHPTASRAVNGRHYREKSAP